MNNMNVEVGKKYKHFKGHICKIIAIAKHSETLEEMVVYEHGEEKEVWVRPLSMFMEKVDKEKYPSVEQEYRFQEINK